MQTLFPTSVSDRALRSMFAARKEVFVDLLKWDLPILEGRYEIDQFDTRDAEYLIVAASNDRHRASARLLPTDRPHLLDTVFPHLCTGPIPTGPSTREITRFCLDRHQRSAERREARNTLISALVDHALEQQIEAYTGVANLDWFEQVRNFGWDCSALGRPALGPSGWLTALHIRIDQDTPARLCAHGIYRPVGAPDASPLRPLHMEFAA
jgi:N-acyl-L-homoserine lactone synthetase